MAATEEQLYVAGLTQEEKAELASTLKTLPVWNPMPGPQEAAKTSAADILFYGGAAGGGKTDLGIGMALTQHTKSIIFRREATQLTGIIDRMTELLGNRNGYHGQDKVWRLRDRQVEFGSTPTPGDETRYQGRPHDLIFFDEISNFLEFQFRFLMGWLRTTKPNQRCRVICAGNPPTSSDGDWVRKFWAPWLDKNHPNPAEPGELRWYVTGPTGKDVEVEDDSPRIGQELRKATFEEIADPTSGAMKPKSRTFIPSKVTDNPYLIGTNYVATLQALPEPLRSQMLNGNFHAGIGDDAWQAIPSAWVHAAQERWTPPSGYMTAMGVDPSRSGDDESVIYCCHNHEIFSYPETYPGHVIPDGPSLAAEILRVRRNNCPIRVDGIGIGTSVVDHLIDQGIDVDAITGNEQAQSMDETGTFRFKNQRAEIYWRLRERLDPKNNPTLALPKHSQLTADLCAPRFTIREGNVIQLESKRDIKKRIGRSPDHGDALAYAAIETQHQEKQTFIATRTGRVKRNLTCIRQTRLYRR